MARLFWPLRLSPRAVTILFISAVDLSRVRLACHVASPPNNGFFTLFLGPSSS